jgi:hypothetical protein
MRLYLTWTSRGRLGKFCQHTSSRCGNKQRTISSKAPQLTGAGNGPAIPDKQLKLAQLRSQWQAAEQHATPS